MNKEICQRCINNKDCKRYVNTVCEVCHQIENAGNGSNQLFLEFLSETPECCGKCTHRFTTHPSFGGNSYCEAARYFDKDDRNIANPYIRKNYLTKNRPKFCIYNDKSG